ncbi:hypothetical protein [Niabella hibiscisoli]|uniref:hypothetical protein n=1 Tax=Niabella hibiscisoli TaxID=1825928 RepID=UPI001F0EF98A|nr:hypothetical protein [Niabella hibiscisoli]MCH5717405.1 hypothetical protein [Niabella hibiscisoli]
MIPIGDDNSGRVLTPYINYLLIAINIVVFVFAQGLGTTKLSWQATLPYRKRFYPTAI